MNLASAISFYLNVNFSIAIASIFLFAFRFATPRGGHRVLLKMHALALGFVALLPMAMLAVPKQPFFQPPAKIWSSPSFDSFSNTEKTAISAETEQPGYFVSPVDSLAVSISTHRVTVFLILCLGVVSFVGLCLFCRDIRRLIQIRRTSHCVRRISSVRIYVHDRISVPFSYWLPLQTNIVMPVALLANPHFYQLALKHEIQHHRQGDTKIVYLLWFLRLFCLANPFVHLWAREISEIQEFACDETLVDRKHVDAHAYARCLFEVAQTAKSFEGAPVCATGLTFQTRGTLLKRRINMMLFQESRIPKRAFLISGLVAMIAVLTATSFAATGLVQDRRVSQQQAEKLLARSESATRRQSASSEGSSAGEFPVVVNERVLRQLNRYIGTPEGREFMRRALARMENERPAIERALAKYGVPRELIAMPIIESGYQNLSQAETQSNSTAAGLWQFMPRTARIFGLRVDKIVDERMNVPILTDAAMRYLVANKMRFQDWALSVSAYNAGEERIQNGIDKTGSRDAWTLIGRGFEGDHDYLAKVMAAILIMNNPETVQ